VAQHFTEKGFVDVNQKRLSISSTRPRRRSHDAKGTSRTSDDDDSMLSSTVEVSGIPADVSEDYLRMYFESEKRSGGGEVRHLDYSQTQGTAAITFISHTGKSTRNVQCNHCS